MKHTHDISNTSAYGALLVDLKEQIRHAQMKAALAVNQHLVLLYWHIGKRILAEQKSQGWGAKVIERLAVDLKQAFPDVKSFSYRNLVFMRQFAEAYGEQKFVKQAASHIPWFHNIIIIQKNKKPQKRLWYIEQTIEHGWSRNVLSMHIHSKLYERQAKVGSGKISNFSTRLPQPHSDLAANTLKDPYLFDFLGLGQEAGERDIEQALTTHIRKFLLELGAGFAFVGTQYPLEVGGDDFYIDMLFYHLTLRCYVVIELKATKFKPEYAGKLNFYLAVVDDLVKAPEDNPTLGLLLCRENNKLVAEYALRDLHKPMGVAEYSLATLESSLPSVADIEHALNQKRA